MKIWNKASSSQIQQSNKRILYHGQDAFTLRLQGWFNIRKPKKKNDIILWIDNTEHLVDIKIHYNEHLVILNRYLIWYKAFIIREQKFNLNDKSIETKMTGTGVCENWWYCFKHCSWKAVRQKRKTQLKYWSRDNYHYFSLWLSTLILLRTNWKF